MSDSLTVLRSVGPRMAKYWRLDGTIEPYDRAKNFTWTVHPVDGIEQLSAALTTLETDPRACVIRGTPKPGAASPVRRLAENFEDTKHHWLLIEIDEFVPLINDPVTEPVDAALEYIRDCLPPEFQDVSFHFQLSNSAGAPSKTHLLKMHLWWWCDIAYDSPTLRAWARAEALQFDRSVMQVVQPNFVSNPVMEEGVADPVLVRSGLVRGKRDSVDLCIDVEVLAIKSPGERLRGDSLEADDPVAEFTLQNWETWGTLPNGGVLVSCPWGDQHSGGAKGDTSSVLFPAGSNGYASGAYVCLHAKCDDKHLSDFTAAIGYSTNALSALAATPEPLNGHVVDLPGFKRDGKGAIESIIANLNLAVAHPPMIGCELRHDRFRDELVLIESGSAVWRAFKDSDYTQVRLDLERAGFKPINSADLRSAIHHYADGNHFDSARFWLDGIVWDGVPRIERYWIDHFGVPDDDRGYARAVGLYTWTALAARAMDPGVQADMVPVLVGAQGVGKSRGVAAMSPVADFSTSMSFHENEVERARKMRGKLVVELAELQGLKSREREEILAWITRSVEHWTPKYMEMATTFARRFICFATTNDDDFLDNPNGERRWLPLAVGSAPGFAGVDVPALHALCEQFWAEGRARYGENGIAWQDAERLARFEHSKFKAEDAWRSAVSAWLDHPDMSGMTPRSRPHMTLHEVAEGALSMPAKYVRYQDQRRLGKLLREEGFELTPKKLGGKSVKVWSAVREADV